MTAEELRSEILRNCGETLRPLLEKRDVEDEKINGLRARITGYEQNIVKSTQRIDELQREIDFAFDRGNDPKSLAKKLRVLKTSIDECHDLIRITAAQIEKVKAGSQQEINQKIVDILRAALKKTKWKIVEIMIEKLIEVKDMPQIFADAICLLSKSQSELASELQKVEIELCSISFVGHSPTKIIIH